MVQQTEKRGLSSAALHILAMGCMLCDHLGVFFPGSIWLPCVGRLAFPIFAFLVAEGARQTHDRGRYMKRLLLLAVLSEIPFDLQYERSIFYPFHQNVIWTFLIALLVISLIERAKRSGKVWIVVLVSLASVAAGYLAGYLIMADYYGEGVLMVLVFYFFRGRRWWELLGQAACLYYINAEMLGGLFYPVTLFGREFELLQQSLAVLALVPIWLYRGRQGCHTRGFRWFCYAFYPAHMLLLYLPVFFL